MATFRIMSYHINGARSAVGEVAPELCAAVIKSQQPDLVMVQRIGSPIGIGSAEQLAKRVGLSLYGSDVEGGCAFLSRYPLKYIQEVPLGFGGQCLQADLELENERIHLFNFTLSLNVKQRRQQFKLLMGSELLNNPSLTCATIVCGDFGLPLWGGGLLPLNDNLKRAGFPAWRANFPGKIPLWGRDRIYFRGPIKALDGNVIMTAAAREASTHLPLVLTVATNDTREVLKVKKMIRVSSKQANPACG
ncbi:MAG: endonuclease/exonuclease/phosphatase family protein [Desulfuromonadales bacterium]|nr:endonuclease/exonuclease/phosphatase family protein [Desulfuromonadales bacterium]